MGVKNIFQTDRAAGVFIFVVLLALFCFSRVHQLADSRYSTVLSQSLYQHGSFTLDNYRLPREEPKQQLGFISDGDIYQLQLANGHIYYSYPIGGPVLSVPFVALFKTFGISPFLSDGSYDADSEGRLQGYLAAFLMAIFGVVIFLTARMLLPLGWSVVIAFGSSLGTQIWSTASRSMWSDTWAVLSLTVIIYILVTAEVGKGKIQPVLFATMLAWLYFARPTNAISIAAITLYILIYYRNLFIPFAITGCLWLAAFVLFSEYHFGSLLPIYYLGKPMMFSGFWSGIAANLISPSRGLFIYVPILLFVGYLLIRYRSDDVVFRRLRFLSVVVIVLHWLLVSGVVPNHGGHSYGPRYFTGAVPWFALAAMISVASWRHWYGDDGRSQFLARWRIECSAGLLLLLLSILLNGLGATSNRRWRWNDGPPNVDVAPERIWDWSDPQFLPR